MATESPTSRNRTGPEAAAVGAPGQPFEVIEVQYEGYREREFKNAPKNLRQFFDLSRGLDQTFIVYEDEEWTFAEVMEEADALGHALVHRYGVKPGDREQMGKTGLPERGVDRFGDAS